MRTNYNNIPTDGLVLDIPLDGNADARVGTDGSATNISWIGSEKGYTSEVGEFNGTSAYVGITNPSSLDNDFSVSLWFNPDVLSTTDSKYLWTGQATRNVGLYFDRTAQTLRFFMYDGTLRYIDIPYASLSVGTYYHVIVTRSKTTGLEIFLDLNSVDTDSYTGNANSNSTADTIGVRGDLLAGSYYDGEIGLLKVYDKVLTSSERQALYLEGQRVFGDGYKYPALLNGLQAYYDFKGDALDVSGKGNDGTVVGATLTTDHLGRSNHAYSFDGTDRITIADDNSLDLTSSGTLFAIIKPSSGMPIAAGIINKRSNDALSGIAYGLMILDDYTLIANICNGSSNSAISGVATISQSVFTSVALTWDNGDYTLYINGEEDNSTTGNVDAQVLTNSVHIGVRTGSAAFYKGIIASPMIINRGLSAGEMKTLHQLTTKQYIYAWNKSSTLGLQDGLILNIGDSAGNDYSGQGNNGTPVGSPVLVRVNQSEGLIYNGTTQYINLPTAIYNNTNSFSVGAWVKYNDVSSIIKVRWYQKVNGSYAGTIMSTGEGVDAGKPWFGLYNTGTSTFLYAKFPTAAVNGVWYHIVGTFDSSVGQAQIYVNGVAGTASFAGITTLNGDTYHSLGRYFTQEFDGEIINHKIWNRALTISEIQQDYYLPYLPN